MYLINNSGFGLITVAGLEVIGAYLEVVVNVIVRLGSHNLGLTWCMR